MNRNPFAVATRSTSASLLFAATILITSIVLAVARPGQATPSYPLDQYPGLGRSPDAVLRDDTIAYWEAYERELATAACMNELGFDYWPDVAFPTDAVISVREGLPAPRQPAAAWRQAGPPSDRNQQYSSTLNEHRRDEYYLALFGESADDIDFSTRTGRIPPGRAADFATGGCFGQSSEAIGSIWTERLALEPEFGAMRDAIWNSDIITRTRADYQACSLDTIGVALQGPDEVDEAAAAADLSGRPATLLQQVNERCDTIWADGYRQAELAETTRFIERHRERLAALEERYGSVMHQITRDQGFLSYLDAHAQFEIEAADEHGHRDG